MLDKQTVDILKYISTLHRKTQMYLNDRLKELGLTCGQAPFILLTCEGEWTAQNHFCEALDMDKSTVAKMLMKLESQGYILRRPCESDSRAVEVAPTEKAKQIALQLRKIGRDWSDEIMAGMTGVERAIFGELLERADRNVSSYFLLNGSCLSARKQDKDLPPVLECRSDH